MPDVFLWSVLVGEPNLPQKINGQRALGDLVKGAEIRHTLRDHTFKASYWQWAPNFVENGTMTRLLSAPLLKVTNF